MKTKNILLPVGVALGVALLCAATVKISEIGRHLPFLNGTNYFPVIVNNTNATVTYSNLANGAKAIASLVDSNSLTQILSNRPEFRVTGPGLVMLTNGAGDIIWA